MVLLGDMIWCWVPSMDNSGIRESQIKAKYNQQARECEMQALERCLVHAVSNVVHGEH